MMSVVNSGRPSEVHGLVTVQLREDPREWTIVDIGTILGLAHLILETTDWRWIVNSRIDLRTFNESYQTNARRGPGRTIVYIPKEIEFGERCSPY